MKDGFIKAAAVTPKVQVADPEANAEEIIRLAAEAAAGGAKLIVFPELCITGYTCGDLFLQELLLRGAREALFPDYPGDGGAGRPDVRRSSLGEGRKALQCGGGLPGRKASGPGAEDLPAQLRGIL